MSLANDPQFQAFLHSHKHVVLPIGTAFVVKFSEPFPPMARKITQAEGHQHLQLLKTILDQWSIVAFDQGAICGAGYQYEFKNAIGNECGEGFALIQGQYQ